MRDLPAPAISARQLPQRLGFDLSDALARDVEFLADLFEGVLALAANAKRSRITFSSLVESVSECPQFHRAPAFGSQIELLVVV
jgi:hypothetical protein